MKLIVITRPDYTAGEEAAIAALFADGLQCLHLRKPNSPREDYERLIRQIPAQYRDRIVIHEHFELADPYGLRGVHLNRRNPAPLNPPSRENSATISKSCHTIDELRGHCDTDSYRYDPQTPCKEIAVPIAIGTAMTDRYDYVFLSPVFDSISKAGYRSAFTHEALAKAAEEGLINERVIALGGIDLNNIAQLNAYGFGGAALLGAAWTKDFSLKRLRIRANGGLQFITHANGRYDTVQGARLALAGGCRWVQLRMKDAPQDELERTAIELRELCRSYEAVFIMDDHVELVRRVGADGVHLGKTDMPVAEARKLLGERFIIGGTANGFEDIEELARADADYIGLGPFRFTETKKNLSPVLGAESYRRIAEQCREAGIALPMVAIGGITAADISEIRSAGDYGIALSGAILNAEEPVREMKLIKRLLIG